MEKGQKAPQVPAGITGAVSWRAENIKYRKNEVFLDVVEKINLMVCLVLLLGILMDILLCRYLEMGQCYVLKLRDPFR